jgi:hypothetical protein
MAGFVRSLSGFSALTQSSASRWDGRHKALPRPWATLYFPPLDQEGPGSILPRPCGQGEREGMKRMAPLQWVHGPRTVVISSSPRPFCARHEASMGPRFENRGYRGPFPATPTRQAGFNGSTVREPWLSAMLPSTDTPKDRRFNGSTVREPWLSLFLLADSDRVRALQWVHGL